MIYIVTADDGATVKIGKADVVDRRKRELEKLGSVSLKLLRVLPGEIPTEKWFHRQFAALRLKGEWFTFSPEMLTCLPPDDDDAGRRKHLAPLAEAVRREAQSWVTDAVEHRRSAHGLKRALSKVAKLYGLKERRVIQYLRGQVKRPPADEYLAMRKMVRTDIEERLGEVEKKQAWVRAQLAEIAA